MMIIRHLNSAAEKHGLNYLVIGGHAVTAHGYQRTTSDLDIAVCFDDLNIWMKIFEGWRYKAYRETEAFVQFSPPAITSWPVDAMIVDRDTFCKLLNASKEVDFGEGIARIPSVDHLIIMKLHALKHGLKHRELKDLMDLIQLFDSSSFELDSEEFRQVCEKYAN